MFADIAGQILTTAKAAVAISGSLHAPVSVSKGLANDLVFIQPGNAQPLAVLNALAISLHARATETRGGFVIERNAEDLRKFSESRAAERAAWISRKIDHIRSYRTALLKQERVDSAFLTVLTRQSEELREISQGKRTSITPFQPEQVLPAESLLEELAGRMGFLALGRLPSDEVRVYSDDAKGREEKLPSDDDLIAQLNQQMKGLASVTIDPIEMARLRVSGDEERVSEWSKWAPVARLRLIQSADENGMKFFLDGFEEGGKLVVSAFLNVGPTDVQQTSAALLQELLKKPGIRRVPLSSGARQALDFGQGMSTSPLPEWFAHPDQTDPLSTFVREALVGMAQQTPERLVCVAVSDSLWYNTKACIQDGAVNLDALLATIEQWNPYECVDYNGALVWRPKDFESDRRSHADRKVLARFVREFLAHDARVDVRTAARFLHDASLEEGLPDTWLTLAQRIGGTPGQIQCSLGAKFLRAVGSASDDGWAALTSGRIVTASEAGFVPEMEQYILSSPRLRASGLGLSDEERYPAELMPGGLLPESGVELLVPPPPLIRVWTQKEGGGAKTVTELLPFFRLHTGQVTWNGTAPLLNVNRDEFEKSYPYLRFRICSQERYRVQIGLPKDAWISADIEGNVLPLSDVMSYGNLPLSVRDAIWQHASEQAIADARWSRDHPSPPIFIPKVSTPKPPP